MPSEVISRAIDRLLAGEDLAATAPPQALEAVMSGEAGAAQTAGFLIALRAKGETAAELAGLAAGDPRPRRARARRRPGPFIDTCGTGGGRSTFNISTTATFVVAGAGVAVAKHGNRSATSSCGSADVLEALGARIDLDPDGVSPLPRGDRPRLHVRAGPPPGVPPHRPGAPGARRADDLQPARPAHQPGRRAAPAARRQPTPPTSSGWRPPWPSSAASGRWWCAGATAWTRCSTGAVNDVVRRRRAAR